MNNKVIIAVLLALLIGVSAWFWHDHRTLEERLSHSAYNPCLVTAPDGNQYLITDCGATTKTAN